MPSAVQETGTPAPSKGRAASFGASTIKIIVRPNTPHALGVARTAAASAGVHPTNVFDLNGKIEIWAESLREARAVELRLGAAGVHYVVTGAQEGFSASPLDLPLRHQAIHQSDGKVIVHDVPLFVETVERQGKSQPFTKAWLIQAMAKFSDQPGYWAPMHFRHNDGETDRERAGDFRVSATRLRIVEGKPQWVSFGSLRYDNEAKFTRALAEFPYRSIEVSRDRPDEFNSLALLTSEAPFHRLPNLVAFATDAAGTQSQTWRTRLMADLIDNPADALLAQMGAEGEGEKPTDIKAEADKGKSDEDAPVSRKEFAAFMTKMESAIAKLGEKSEPAEKKKDEAPARSPVAAASASTRDLATFQNEDALKVTKLEAERDAMDARLKAIEDERALERLGSKFATELAPYGEHHVRRGNEILKAKGEEHARTYADTIKATVRPTARGPAARAQFAAEPDEPKEVAAYATSGDPQRLRKAREAHQFFAANRGSLGDLSLAGFLKSELGEAK